MAAPETLPADFFDQPQSLPADFNFDDPIHAQPSSAKDLPTQQQFDDSHKAAVKKLNDSMGGPTAAHPAAAPQTAGDAFKEMATAPIIPFSKLAPDHPTTKLGGVAKGAADFAEGMTTPGNLMLAAAPVGELGAALGKIGAYLPRAVSAIFSADMLHSAYKKIPEVKAAIDKGDWPAAAEAITTAGLTAGMGVLAGAHAVKGETAPTTSAAAAESAKAGVAALNPDRLPGDFFDQSPVVKDSLPTQLPADFDFDKDLKDPNRRVSGSVNMPLNDGGRQEMQDLAQKTAGQFTQIEHSPNDRAAESASIIQQANPQAAATPAPGLAPWAMGEHEGQPIETEKDAIAQRIKETPDEAPPGQHDQSTAPGEPFNAAKDRTVQHFQEQAGNLEPEAGYIRLYRGQPDALYGEATNREDAGRWFTPSAEQSAKFGPNRRYVDIPKSDFEQFQREEEEIARIAPGMKRLKDAVMLPAELANKAQPLPKVLNIASGRTLRILDSYLKNGAPEDGSIDTEAMAREGDWHKTGDLFHVTPEGLKPADTAEKPGIYYARHGATDWNGEPDSVVRESRTTQNSPSNEGVKQEAAPIRETKPPQAEPAYGRDVPIAVPGETTKYPARYAVRELSDVQASHNPQTFLANPNYEYVNDRDYSRGGNAARVIKNSSPDTFDPNFVTTEAPTAEHGTPVIDSNGNVLGGNSRTMAIARVYNRGGAEEYMRQVDQKAQQFGIDPQDYAKFKRPVLLREIAGDVDAQKAITDFNKAAAAELTPEERAVSDGRRLSPETIKEISGRLGELGEEGTLASALRGDDGADILDSLVKDGVLTDQEKGGYLDGQRNLTPEAKARIGKALVGRLYDSPADFRGTSPETRAKLERVAPQVLRVETREGWGITDQLREAVALADEARGHKLTVEEQVKQTGMWSNKQYSPDAVAIAKTLEENPVKAAGKFRRYANDEALSRPGGQSAMFTPPTRAEAFSDAFAPKKASGVVMGSGLGGLQPIYEKFEEEDIKPFVRKLATDLVEAKDQIQQIVAPTVRGESAMMTGLSLRQRMSQFARRFDQGAERLKVAREFFNNRAPEENFAFIDNIERGRDQGDEDLNAIARTFRGMMDQRRREVQGLGEGALKNFYLNYFPHVFEKPELATKLFDSFFNKRALEGPKAFLKHREFPTFKEALEAGAKPVSDNPVDLILLKTREMDRYLLAHNVLRDLAERGIAKRLARTEEEGGQLPLESAEEGPIKRAWIAQTKADLPPNFVRIVDPVGGGKWHAEDGAAQVLNNFLSPGLRARSGAARILLGLNNVMNQANLGLSAFHLKAETISSMAGRASNGFVKAMQGHPLEGGWKILSSPAAPFLDYMKGSELLREWYKPGSQGAPIAAIADSLMKGGGRAGQPADFRSQALGSMLKQWKRGNYIGAAARSPFAALEVTTAPLMEHLIPRMKLGAFAEIAQGAMEELGPGARVEDVQRAMAAAWDHVENRLGEMTYDNLFWNRSFKDVMHLVVRSVGWNLGDLREYNSAGGALKQLATGKRPADLHGLGFVMGYAFTAAWMGAVYQYLKTGKGPEQLEDYMFPKGDGGKRQVIAPYVKDSYQFARDLPGTLIHKTGPLVNTLAEMATNKDYYDRDVRNLDDPLVKQMQQEAGFVLRQFLPFTLQEMFGPQTKKSKAEAADRSANPEHAVEHFLGVQPAPATLQPGYKPKKDKG